MKLLFDENISYRILKKLNVAFNDSEAIRNKPDIEIWNIAKNNHFTIVTFDEDFYDIQLTKGFPPKVIWLRCGNTSTDHIALLLNSKIKEINQFIQDDEFGVFEIY